MKVATALTAALAAAMTMPAFAQAPAACEKFINIGAWNVQWLGNAKGGGRKPQDPKDIAGYLAASKVDVLALAEISATSTIAGQAKNAPLDDAIAILNAAGGQWRYALFDKRIGARAPDDQWSGIAWNEAVVKATGGPWKLDVEVDLKRENEIRARLDKPETETLVLSRWPQAMKFSAGTGKTDFVVVPVHLKSNIGGPATADARAYEVELIRQGLDKLKSKHMDADIIVAGDTNMLNGTEPAADSFKAMGLKDCNARDLGTHLSLKKGEKAAPFDRIFLSNSQPETSGSCSTKGNGKDPADFKIMRPGDFQAGMQPSDFRKRLSDHQLVRTGICVMADDD